MTESHSSPAPQTESLCTRCKANPAVIKGRNDSTCESCFKSYVFNKLVKKLNLLRKEILGHAKARTLKYLVGLSLGASSSTLVHMLAENRRYLSEKTNGKVPTAFDLVIVHVDTDLTPRPDGEKSPAATQLEKYAERFPGLDFQCMPLSRALEIQSIDWDALPKAPEELHPTVRIQKVFDGLPSLTSRADILRLFIRHILLEEAVRNESDALLLGCTETALAEMTLSEVAKGRGFSAPWQVNDGPYPIPQRPAQTNGTDSSDHSHGHSTRATINLHYPLREVFRKEIKTYLDLATPSIVDLLPDLSANTGSVVSHKNLSIEEAIARYFESVEEGYPAVVANVVRTIGKLDRTANTAACSMCGMDIDEHGEARWKGEIGHDDTQDGVVSSAQLCYGCERSIRG